ncbi:MAG TPA: hypothetical protein RMH85_01610 [Polyangiaceae bacterium LLY-WYZ-15_(1-7)]|nr:hypothetical protein [Myxococcales bacterium]HJL05043.1 hypothetical protein [Polyangiaceae bacterium LLY-WYZ-15_(1-7)]HJL07160.1 hypothetical protein [Polyangiaceae bacterium LLY-WYZ-15_(1-7)]HJL21742.1 hypothetical protein [Polyangiaceae bacterium LLY-WYZ-15_(1-7)]HJL35821.1 hypothetical protein [Polyangiaceae bacterium LLY-WYZ-15_(1-7)]
MIVELAVGAGLVAAAALAYRALKRVPEPGAPDDARPDDADVDEKAGGDDTEKPKARKKPKRTGPRGLRVGDVLLYAGSELWLAGCFDLDEEGFVARLFCAPGGERAEWVLQLDPEARDIALLDATDEVPGGRVPSELPIGGMRLSLRKRGHALVTPEGDSLPPATEKAEYVLLGGAGGRVLFVVDFEGGDRIALAGEQMGRELFDLLPGGDE